MSSSGAENTSEILKFQSVLNIDKCFKERKFTLPLMIGYVKNNFL